MIDRPARNQLAEALRALASGLITNDEFEERIPFSNDPAIGCIYLNGVWGLYSDLWEYRLKGKDRLSPNARAAVARCVLFLKTDQEFEWPQPSFMQRMLSMVVGLLTLGWASRSRAPAYRAAGDGAVWPFISRDSFEQALRKPVYLCG
jgi:hypothetical protein